MRTKKWIAVVGSFLIIFISITGCSDNSYTGPMINHYTGSMLQPGDVDKYLFTSIDGRICIGTDYDSVCAAQRYGNQPIIHILPKKLVYVFYYDEEPILQVEKDMDTTEIIDKVGGGDPTNDNGKPTNGNNPTNTGEPTNDNGKPTNGNNPTNTGDPTNDNGDPTNTSDPTTGEDPTNTENTPNGDTGNPINGGDPTNTGNPPSQPDDNDDDDDNDDETSDGGIFTKPVKAQDENSANGWYIWLYYPKGRFEAGILSLEASGLEITINGNEITDDDIVSFEQGSSEHGTYFKFFYPTAKSTFTELTIQVTGLVSPTGTVNFIISAPS